MLKLFENRDFSGSDKVRHIILEEQWWTVIVSIVLNIIDDVSIEEMLLHLNMSLSLMILLLINLTVKELNDQKTNLSDD